MNQSFICFNTLSLHYFLYLFSIYSSWHVSLPPFPFLDTEFFSMSRLVCENCRIPSAGMLRVLFTIEPLKYAGVHTGVWVRICMAIRPADKNANQLLCKCIKQKRQPCKCEATYVRKRDSIKTVNHASQLGFHRKWVLMACNHWLSWH